MKTLPEYIAAHLLTPFQWGVHDCVLFAAGWVKIATGRDVLEGVPRWSNEREARRLLAQLGGLEALLDARFTRISPNLAGDGCLALYGDTGVCVYSGCHIVGPNPAGLEFVDRLEAACAWSL